MKTPFITIILTTLCLSLHGQEWYNDPNAHMGAVVLNDKSIIRGYLSYDQTAEKIYIDKKDDTESRTVGAEEASYFQFYDEKNKFNRYFFALRSFDGSTKFYELLLNGKIPLYRKAFLSSKKTIDSNHNVTNIYLGKWVEHNYYYEDNGVMHLIKNFKKEIVPYMKDEIALVSKFITKEKLNTQLPEHQLLIIDFFNQISQ